MNNETSSNPFDAFSRTGSSFAKGEVEKFEVQHASQSNTPIFSSLAENYQQHAMELARELNHEIYENVLTFGRTSQEKMTQFTSQLLKHTQRQDVNSTGKLLTDLLVELEKINPDALIQQEQGFIAKLFQKKQPSISELMSQYTRLKVRIDRLSIQLEHSQQQLLKEYNMLDSLYDLNEEYFHHINTFIAAAEIKIDQLLRIELKKFEEQARLSNDPLDQHAINDLHMQIEWIDKRKYDLEISREIAIQSAPQIRLIQQTGQMLIEKTQTSVMATIPLWQSQIAMLLSMNQQRRIAQSEQKLVRASEQLSRKNAAMYTATKNDTTKQRAVSNADLERFRQTQLKLLRDIEETLSIQQQANDKLRLAEQQLK